MSDPCDIAKLHAKLSIRLKGASRTERDRIWQEFFAEHLENCAALVLALECMYSVGLDSGISEGIQEGIQMEKDSGPPVWEKALTWISALAILGVVLFLLCRNEPIADPNFVVIIRLLLSAFAGVLGYTIPGMLNLDVQYTGLKIRATGAIALCVLTYVFTPTVIARPVAASPKVTVSEGDSNDVTSALKIETPIHSD